jgi:hypothetical protein
VASSFCLTFWSGFKKLQFKDLGMEDYSLISVRLLIIIGLIIYSIIETIICSSISTERSQDLHFVYVSRFIGQELIITFYISGAIAFGAGVEIFIFILHAIVNCVLLSRNGCSRVVMAMQIIWVLKLVFLGIFAQLLYWNFRKYYKYDDDFKVVARALQRQAFIYSVSILIVSADSLSAIYAGVYKSLPFYCQYDTNHCGIVELNDPAFSYSNEKCMGDLKSYVKTRAQVRLIRYIMIINIISYAVFNCNFLAVDDNRIYSPIRYLLNLLYGALIFTFLVACSDPLIFISKYRLVNDISELFLFLIWLGFLVRNLIQLQAVHFPGERMNTEIYII